MTSSWIDRIPMTLAQFVPFMMAIVFHEVAHAWVALRFGDTTARDQGRLTINPLPHIDWMGTVLFPLINMLSGLHLLFGWARPVPVNYSRLKPYRKGLFFVSIAGIFVNFFMAFIAAFFLLLLTVIPQFYLTEPFLEMCKAAMGINLSLAFFNLIPLPPLDGSKAIEAFLSLRQMMQFEKIQSYSFFILMALLFTGALNFLVYPIMFVSELYLRFWTQIFALLGYAT